MRPVQKEYFYLFDIITRARILRQFIGSIVGSIVGSIEGLSRVYRGSIEQVFVADFPEGNLNVKMPAGMIYDGVRAEHHLQNARSYAYVHCLDFFFSPSRGQFRFARGAYLFSSPPCGGPSCLPFGLRVWNCLSNQGELQGASLMSTNLSPKIGHDTC